MIGIKIHVLEKKVPMLFTQGKPLNKNKKNLPCSFGAGLPDFKSLSCHNHIPLHQAPWHLMLQWNGGLKRVKRRRSQKTPLEVSGSEAGAEVSTNSRETWHGETAEKFCCTNRSVLEPTPREANLNVKMIGKNPFVRFHHFWSSGHGLQRWKWGTKSWQMIIFQYISLRWRARGLEERTNTLLLCTRFGTSWGWRHLTSLEFAYVNWDAGADA